MVQAVTNWPQDALIGPDKLWGTSLGNFGPLRASQGIIGPVSSQLGHFKAVLVMPGPLQVSMNINLSISDPHFVLKISQPPNNAQKWFYIQNYMWIFVFRKTNGLKISFLIPKISNKNKRSIFYTHRKRHNKPGKVKTYLWVLKPRPKDIIRI